MDKKGRKCEVVKIGKDKAYFITDWKGKEVMAVMSLIFGDTDMRNNAADIDAGKLIVHIPELFEIFCVAIERGEEEIKPDKKYLEDLPAKEYIKIQNRVGEDIREMLESSTKKD